MGKVVFVCLFREFAPRAESADIDNLNEDHPGVSAETRRNGGLPLKGLKEAPLVQCGWNRGVVFSASSCFLQGEVFCFWEEFL